MPYFGGLAIYLAVLIPLCLFYQFEKNVLAILLAGTLVLILGLIDDFGVLTPTAKFIGQFIAAVVLIKGDILIRVEVFHPYVNLFLTLLWIIGMTNAMNIIDIMDGLAAGVALIASAFLFIVSLMNHYDMIAMFAVTLIGSLAGFLPYNFRPARIYMGDAGSMFLGLMLGTLAILVDYSAPNKLAFLNPILFFGVAIFDTMYVMLLRAINGRSMFLGSKDHFAVRLKLAGWSTKKIVLSAYAASLCLGISCPLQYVFADSVFHCFILHHLRYGCGSGLASRQNQSSLMETEVLVIGAGLAGLSAGYHLGKIDHILVEAESRVGGLCKSFYVDGFHFDCTGHLIHFRTAEGRSIITGLLGDRIQEHQRKSAIYLQGRYTDYPFQANTYGLPAEVIKECVLGFAQTLLHKKKTQSKKLSRLDL